QGADRIVGGTATNIILGDSGQITAAPQSSPRFGGLPITLGRVETTADGIGGNDTIVAGSGPEVIFGGTGADRITGGGSTNIVFGDDGYVDWIAADGDPTDIDVVASTTPADGGDDTITIGTGDAIVVGGQGNDRITGGS